MKILSFCLFIMVLTSAAVAQSNKTILLYPSGVPNSKPTPKDYVEKIMPDAFVGNVTAPTLQPYFPEKGKATGTAVIIFPGGGYAGLSMVNEGSSIAEKFNSIGVAAFVLKYRLPSDKIMVDKNIGPLQDAQRAVQMVRERAKEWGIAPDKIGVIGFSAGGHLASTAETHFNKAAINNPHQTSLRPDFAILLYPVVSFGTFAHQGSKDNLVGTHPSAETTDLYSNEKQVSPQTPPTFLVHAEDDNVVPVQNSILFYDAMVKAGVKGELHIYEKGGHGFGLHNKTTRDEWFDRCANWMQANGWLNK